MSIIVGSADELEELHLATSLSQRTGENIPTPVSKIVTYNTIKTVDRNRDLDFLRIQAFTETGEGAVDELITFEIDDPDNTETFFIINHNDQEYPLKTAASITGDGGWIVLADQLRTGGRPGTVTVKVKAASSGSTAQAEIIRNISHQIPYQIKAISGGNESFPVNSYVFVNVAAHISDTVGQPISYGHVRFSIYDPFETGTIMIGPGGHIIYIGGVVDPNGMAAGKLPVRVGNSNPGADFYIRADRDGKAPFYLFKYSTLPIGA